MVVYKVWYYYYVIYFCIPFVQGATVFYWRIWQNLRVAFKALSRQLLSICSDSLLSNYKTIYRPFENGMFNELYCCDANGCPAVWSKCNLGKSIHYWRAVPLALSRKVVFFKMTPAGHPPLFNRIFFIIFLLFLLFNNYPFIPNGMLFFRNLKHLSLCGQSSWPGSGCDQVPRNNSEGFVCDMFLLCCWSLPFIQWKGRQPSPDVIC